MTGADVVTYDGGELAPTSTLFGTDNPGEVVERAAKVARTLEQLVRAQKLVVRIGQSDHVRVEGWTLLGSMLGVFPVVEWTRPVMDGDVKVGWEARVEARTRGGETVGAAEAECLRDERTWKGRDDYALRSMAQTRAVSKALRLPLGFVMQIAGFSPTPAEEMPQETPPRRADVVGGRGVSEAAAAPDDGLFPPADHPEPGPLHAREPKMAKKLDVQVTRLREGGHLTTEQLWRGCNLDPELGRGEDGELHWSPLRDRLSREQAMELISRLEKFEETVLGSAFAARAAEAVARREGVAT